LQDPSIGATNMVPVSNDFNLKKEDS